MNEKIVVTEKMHPEKEWFKEATGQTVESLPEFINHLMNDYEHDYGTIVHAIAACAIAAAWAADRTENGGITGFQASFVMWDFIRQWSKPNNKCGLKLVDYDDFLFPQYDYKYEKTLSKDNWEAIQKEAERMLEEIDANQKEAEERAGEVDVRHPHPHPDVVKHWQAIVAGNVPFGYRIRED